MVGVSQSVARPPAEQPKWQRSRFPRVRQCQREGHYDWLAPAAGESPARDGSPAVSASQSCGFSVSLDAIVFASGLGAADMILPYALKSRFVEEISDSHLRSVEGAQRDH